MTTNQEKSSENFPYIPNEAYLLFPQGPDAKKSASDRIVFEGNTQFDAQEQQVIKQFKSTAGGQLKPTWSDALILRILMAQGMNQKKALTALVQYDQFLRTAFPVRMDAKLQNYLNSGIVYVSGRDHKFRPILVMNLARIDLNNLDTELISRYFNFWLSHVIEQWMLPGQVEAWNWIIDVKDVKLGTKSVSTLSKVFQNLQDNYQCRLNSLYIVNTPKSIYVPWKVAKKMLDEVTLSKIALLKESSPQNLFRIANKTQVEQKYGGSAPNITQYWPPAQANNNYFVSPSDASALVSKEEYAKRYQSGILKGMIINKSFVGSAPAPTNNNNQQNQPQTQQQNQPQKQQTQPAPQQNQVPNQNNQVSLDDLVGGAAVAKQTGSYGAATLDSLPDNVPRGQLESTDNFENVKMATPQEPFYVDELIESEGEVHHPNNFEAHFIPLPDMHIKLVF